MRLFFYKMVKINYGFKLRIYLICLILYMVIEKCTT